MHPILFRIPLIDLPIHTYGLMIALAFLFGMQLSVREAKRVDLSPKRDLDQFTADLTFWILIAAMIGARVLFIIAEWDGAYARNPLRVFKVWEGGLVFYGGLIGSLLFVVYYCRRKKRDPYMVSDVLIPNLALGQCFGRLGCLAAGCCWGEAVDPSFPLAVQFPVDSLAYSSMARLGQIAPTELFTGHVHPVQLYESFGALFLFFFLIFLRSKKRFHGQVLAGYLACYAILRSSLEVIRGDIERGENIWGTPFSTSQLISFAMFGIAVAIIVRGLKQRKRFRESAASNA